MNNLIFLANEAQITDACAGLGSFIGLAKIVVKILQIVVPIALIIWGSLDMLKAIIAGDEKKISAARKPLIQRFVSAVIVFLIPWLFNCLTIILANVVAPAWFVTFCNPMINLLLNSLRPPSSVPSPFSCAGRAAPIFA